MSVSGQDRDGQNQDGTGQDGTSVVTVYTRPGCPFCTMLRTGLRRQALRFSEVDIWQDPEAAAIVRSLADGNETVPTVVIGTPAPTTSGPPPDTGSGATGGWTAVNPSTEAVMEAVAAHAPDLLPDHKPGPVEGALSALGLRGRKERGA